MRSPEGKGRGEFQVLAKHTRDPETGALGIGWASLRASRVPLRITEISATLCVGFLALGPLGSGLPAALSLLLSTRRPRQIKAGPPFQLAWSKDMLGSVLGTEEDEGTWARPLGRTCLSWAQGLAPLGLHPGLTLQLHRRLPGLCEGLFHCLPVAGCVWS